MHLDRLAVLSLASLLALAGCSKEAGAPPAAAPAASRFLLSSEPAGAVSVLDAKAHAPKDDAVVVGRVREVSPGVAAFVLVDTSLTYCGEKPGEGKDEAACEEPWDYCCHDAGDIAKHSVPVSVRAAGGDVERATIPELRPLDLVVVRGRVLSNPKGGVEVAATGWYRKERPVVSDKVKFP
jgi:hypothetical protein